MRHPAPRPNPVLLAGLLGLVLLGAEARADQVQLKNGDRLTGKIQSMIGGKLLIKTDLAGDVTIDQENILTFSTDEEVQLVFKDGTVFQEMVQTSETGGSAHIAGGQIVNDQEFPIAELSKINPPPLEWSGKLVVGAEWDAGNTEERSYSASVEGTRRSADDRVFFHAQYSSERDKINNQWQSTEREIAGGLQYDYFLTEKRFAWTALKANKDAFEDLDLRLIAGVGLGQQWVERPDLNFQTMYGVTWVSENYSDKTPDDSHVGGRLAYRLDHQVTNALQFFNNVDWIPSMEDSKDHYAIGSIGLRHTLTSDLYAELSANVEWDSTPADDAERTDTTYILGIGWSF